MKSISSRIKEALVLREMKQSELVKKTGIGKSSISTYISGAYEPKQRNIYKLAEALNVSESWLMGFDVPMKRVAHTDKLQLDTYKSELLDNYEALNSFGKKEALKRVAELKEIFKYTKKNTKIDDFIIESNVANLNNEIAKFVAHTDEDNLKESL